MNIYIYICICIQYTFSLQLATGWRRFIGCLMGRFIGCLMGRFIGCLMGIGFSPQTSPVIRSFLEGHLHLKESHANWLPCTAWVIPYRSVLQCVAVYSLGHDAAMLLAVAVLYVSDKVWGGFG